MNGERAVIDRVDQTRSDGGRHSAVRHGGRIVDGCAQRVEVALVKRLVGLLESPGCSAAFFFTRHLRVNPAKKAAKRVGRQSLS